MNRFGFVLVELMVVIVALAIVVSLMFMVKPSYNKMPPKATISKGDYAVVKVFYATDRNRTLDAKPSTMYGNDRAEISYGTCEVSIPSDHRMGELEAPSIWRLEFREDPEKHVVLLEVSAEDKDSYFSEVASRVRESSKKSAFIFVHGYNVTFENAARRTAQMSYDLGFDGAPVFYSWPSQGTVTGYTVDETNIEWTRTDLKRFLEDFSARTDAECIYLIAHSMGNRALIQAFADVIAEKPDLIGRFREVILTAPDIDAEVFKREIAPRIIGQKTGITLYASSEDKALQASKTFHGYPRAGDSGLGLVVMPGIETVDATNVDTSFLGHSYFAESRSVLSDIFYLIHDGKRADGRFSLKSAETPDGRYWTFKQ
ncbi:MAG: alpha/beta hydrolase [Candidatus Omnitrophota bacterium]